MQAGAAMQQRRDTFFFFFQFEKIKNEKRQIKTFLINAQTIGTDSFSNEVVSFKKKSLLTTFAVSINPQKGATDTNICFRRRQVGQPKWNLR